MSTDLCQSISQCRVCSGSALVDVLPFGEQPLANSLKPAAAAPEEVFPLTLCCCSDCGLVQIRETIAPERLFSHYVWVTQTSSTARAFAYDFADRLQALAALDREDFVLEIASNDGTYLRPFLERGYRHVLGIDPAANIVSQAQAEGIPCLNAFWNLASARLIAREHGQAQAIFARNVIPHIAQLQEPAEALSELLAPTGVGAIEFHYAERILSGLQYDSIYHEHLCYFSLATIERLLSRYGLKVFEAEASPISGGALIVYFSHQARALSEQIQTLRRREAELQLNQPETWLNFGLRCQAHRDASVARLASFTQPIVAYGASARSSTYLNYCGFSQAQISAVIDNNPLKQGRFTAGSGIEILSYDQGMQAAPETILLLAWNFEQEIVADCRRRGYQGGFIVPFPNQIKEIAAEEQSP